MRWAGALYAVATILAPACPGSNPESGGPLLSFPLSHFLCLPTILSFEGKYSINSHEHALVVVLFWYVYIYIPPIVQSGNADFGYKAGYVVMSSSYWFLWSNKHFPFDQLSFYSIRCASQLFSCDKFDTDSIWLDLIWIQIIWICFWDIFMKTIVFPQSIKD